MASARTATVMVCVVALPPWLATIGASTASATIFCNEPSNRPSTEEARNAVTRLTSSQLKRLRAMVHTVSESSSSRTPPSALMSSSASSLDHVDDVVEGDDADQPVVGVDHRRRHQVVALEQPRHLLLVVVGAHAAALRVHQLGDRHRALGAQQTVERHGAEEAAVLVDHIELVEAFRQVDGLAHVVDGLADGPARRHRDELRLHAPAGGILRIVEAASQRDALGHAATAGGFRPARPSAGLREW